MCLEVVDVYIHMDMAGEGGPPTAEAWKMIIAEKPAKGKA